MIFIRLYGFKWLFSFNNSHLFTYTVIWFQIFPSDTNNLHTVTCSQVFLLILQFLTILSRYYNLKQIICTRHYMISYIPIQYQLFSNAVQKQDDQLELTYSNYVRTQDVTLKTCRRRWMIERSGERGSGISVLVARHDDDDDDLTYRWDPNRYYYSKWTWEYWQ